MAGDQAAGIVKGIREAMQDILAPEIREMRADMPAIRDRPDAIDRRFDRLEGHLSTFRNGQTLKEQMAELRAKQQPSA